MIRRMFPMALCLVLSQALAVTAANAAWEIPVEEGDSLTLRGWAARVTYQVVPDAKGLSVSGGETSSAWSWRRESGKVWIEQSLPSTRPELRERASKPREQVAITIRGPSVGAEFFLNEGQVQVLQTRQPVRVTMKQGRVVLQKTAAPIRVTMGNGQVDVVEHQGPLDLDTYEGQLTLKKVEGDVKADLFGADLAVEGGRGQIRLTTRDGKVRVAQWKGGLRFEQDRGTLSLTEFEGRIDGESGEGSVQLAVLPATEVHLKSRKARINVQLPARSGASLNVVNILGELSTPKEVRVYRTAKEKFARGRLPGSDQKILVSIRADDGSVVVK